MMDADMRDEKVQKNEMKKKLHLIQYYQTQCDYIKD